MINNYSQEQLLEYAKYPDKLKNDAESIFLETKGYRQYNQSKY